MIKTFEKYTNSMIEYSLSPIKLFLKRIKNIGDGFVGEIINNGGNKILEINNLSGDTYLDFYIDFSLDKCDIDYILNNFFTEVYDLKQWLKTTKNTINIYETKKILNATISFINKYYSKEYYDFEKQKSIKKFKI